MLELGSMDKSLTTGLQHHRILLAKFHHVFMETGGECCGS
jgi:hypothetical protein